MPDRDAIQPAARGEKRCDLVIAQIRRQPGIDARDIRRHAVEEILRQARAAAHPAPPCRFPPDRMPPPAAGYLPWRKPRPARDARGMQAERGLEAIARQIEIARDRSERRNSAAVSSDDRCGACRTIFGASNSARSRAPQLGTVSADRCVAFDPFRPHFDARNENLRRGIDRHRAEPERPDESAPGARKTRYRARPVVAPSSSASIQRALGEEMLADALHQFGEDRIGHHVQ